MFVRSIRRAVSPQNLLVTSVVALSVTGVVVAAATVGSAQLKKNAVVTAKIKNNGVTSAKIKNGSILGVDLKNGAVTGDKVASKSITGKQVNESTLGKVPAAAQADVATTASNATNADNAATVGGLAPSAFVSSGSLRYVSAKLAGGQTKVLATNGPVSMTATCEVNDSGWDRVSVVAATTKDGATLEARNSWRGGPSPSDFHDRRDRLT